jgi:hypothetical protein
VVLREADPSRQLALLASIATRIGNRIVALYGVMAGAAGSDPEIAEMYRRQQQARYTDQRRVARSLSRQGALRAGLSEARATDIMWAIANPSTHRSLIGERGWATEEYERWLAQVLISALLKESVQLRLPGRNTLLPRINMVRLAYFFRLRRPVQGACTRPEMPPPRPGLM